MIGMLFISLANLSSCKKEEVDNRDKYVGNWEYKTTGRIPIYHGGILTTIPIDEKGTIEVTKSGNNALKIGDKVYTINDENLSGDTENITKTYKGINIVGTYTYSGKLGFRMIILTSSITGTWSDTNGESGTLDGIIVMSLIKK